MIQQTQTQAHTTHDIKVHELSKGNVFFPYCHLQLSYLAIATRIPAMLPLWRLQPSSDALDTGSYFG